jgi:hypothetical protein
VVLKSMDWTKSLRAYVMRKQSPALALGLMLAVAAMGRAASGDLSVRDFLGPPAGKTYTYVAGSETYEVIGLAPVGTQGVKVEERVQIPEDIREQVRGTKIRFPQYDLIAVEGKLMKVIDDRSAEIVLQEPLTPRSSSWLSTGVAYEGHAAIKLRLECTIDAVSPQHVFDATRLVASVRCEALGEKPALSVVTIHKYAQGVGLIEQSIETSGGADRSQGSVRSILQKIETTRSR